VSSATLTASGVRRRSSDGQVWYRCRAIGTFPQAIMKSRTEYDFELVESAKAGDKHAFELLMQRYRKPLLHFLFRYLRDIDDTEDIVQEAFIKAYRSLGRFRADATFVTWLFQIGINTAKYHLVRRGRRGPQLRDLGIDADVEEHLLFDAEVDFDTPESKLEMKEVLASLDHALDTLPEEQRISLELREMEGLSYDEIAEQMHCPVGTVRSRIHRARDTLAAALKRH
jgi:RNA polymerase sigma-70 factor (ECF subfamily)